MLEPVQQINPKQVTADLGMSIIPIHEAIRQLEYDGLMHLCEDTDYLDGSDYQKLRERHAEEYGKLVTKLASDQATRIGIEQGPPA